MKRQEIRKGEISCAIYPDAPRWALHFWPSLLSLQKHIYDNQLIVSSQTESSVVASFKSAEEA